MSLKQFRFNLEFVIDIDDINEETEGVSRRLENQPQHREGIIGHTERQRRLLHALLNNRALLLQYVKQEFLDLLELDAREILEEHLFDESENIDENTIRKVIKTLNTEDQKFYQEAENEGILSEQIEEITHAFSIRLLNAEAEELL